MSPTSPERYRRETSWIYSQGAPPVFKGDLYYYQVDHNLTATAGQIDTTKTAVYILNGEYDWASPPVLGKLMADAIPGASFQEMKGLGHFPMAEDPERFLEYIRPVLDGIAAL